jgi:hypothetical protein
MAKYDPLFERLCQAPDEPLELSFDDVDRLVGGLPASASTHPAWWANESEGGRHVQARAWLNAGRDVEHVDRTARRVRFSPARWRRGA